MSLDALAALLTELYKGTPHDDSPLARTVAEYAQDIAARLQGRGVVVLPPDHPLRTGEPSEAMNRAARDAYWDMVRSGELRDQDFRNRIEVAVRAALAVLRV